ncbi:unnamed protein product [Rangifer tarandus platyrhynchus]|uniref:Uncharacterized protein n=1 Tax=Rangifer tarandus platyrhynchus TaxID=3082113 RepID=A0ABN8Z873_RANTA|nr:unnamed protein product [Rangifer tarandus platyrhynchus]CAI9688413.1 unnamed protein product [Rangifer tarandus platyrhynchus]
MWFGTGDSPPPQAATSEVLFRALPPPPPRVQDIERRKSESLRLFQKLNFSGERRVLSPGWRPLPRPRRRAESPGRPSLSLPPLGHPRTHWTPSPLQSGALASHRGQRDVQDAATTTSRPAPKPSWAGPRPAFIFGGGRLGLTGRRTNLVGGRLPPSHAPRPAWDFGATTEVLERLDKGGRGRTLRTVHPVGDTRTTPEPAQESPLPVWDRGNSAMGDDPRVPCPYPIEALRTQRSLREASRMSGATTPSRPLRTRVMEPAPSSIMSNLP